MSGEGIGAPKLRFVRCQGRWEKAVGSVPSSRKRTCCFVIVDPVSSVEEGGRTMVSRRWVVRERMEIDGGGWRNVREVLMSDPVEKTVLEAVLNLFAIG